MKQSIAILTVLMVALLLVSGYIVASNVVQSDQLIAQTAQVSDLKLKLRAQETLYRNLKADSQELSDSLADLVKERDGLKSGLADALLSVEEANGAVAQQILDLETNNQRHEQEMTDLSTALSDERSLSDSLAEQLEIMTDNRDILSLELAAKSAELEKERTASIAASAAHKQGTLASQEALKRYKEEATSFMELLTLWGRVKSGDAKQSALHNLERKFTENYPESMFKLPSLDAIPATSPTETPTPAPTATGKPEPTQHPEIISTSRPSDTSPETEKLSPTHSHVFQSSPIPTPAFIPIVTVAPQPGL